jgi:hypothetical protein
MRIRMMALSVVALLALSSWSRARADELERGKAMLTTGVIASVGSVAAGIACGVLILRSVGDGLGEHYYYPTHPDEEARLEAGIITACTLNPALVVVGIPLTVAGANKIAKGRRQLRLSLTGVSGTF